MGKKIIWASTIPDIIGFFITIAITTSSMAQHINQDDYIVGPGDVLNIQIWDNNDLNRTVEVSQEGSFTFPFIGRVYISNLSIFQIERLMIKKLTEGYLVAPQVNVTVTEYRNKKVFLFGEVENPGIYILRRSNHLLELISEAGGFTEEIGSTCTIVRPREKAGQRQPKSIRDSGKSEIIHINLDRLISGEGDASLFFIRPGDTIYIGKSKEIYVTGEVKSPGKMVWEKGLTVREAISLAGGGTPRASIKRIRITRRVNGEEMTLKPDLGDQVKPDDIIKVPESYF